MSPPPSADSTKDVDKKSAQRKINKPLIEKRRRARINDCLSQLKSIVLEANEAKSSRPSKLEKADILEMTVEFVKNKINSATGTKIQKTSPSEGQTDYLAGYTKCLAEISNFLEKTRPNMSLLKRDIMSHVTAQFKNHVCQDTSSGLNASLETNPEKLPLPPLPHLKMRNNNSMEEAMDLRINSTEACEAYQQTLESKNEINSHNAVPYTVSHPNMPLGLLYGGQVMLLVQLPSSVAPQEMFTSYGQYLNLSPAPDNVSVPQNSADNPNTIEINKTDDKLKFMYELDSPPQTLESTSTTLLPFKIESIPSVDYRTFNFGSNEVTNQCPKESRDHWRPW